MSISDEKVVELEKTAKRLRYDIVIMIGADKPGHLGGSCSIAEIVAALYFYKMRHDPKNPKWPDRDRFLLSKGHAALTQYAALAEWGYFDKKELSTLKELGTILQGHPEVLRTPGIEVNTGSLGQGLSIACGMAMAGKLNKKDYRVYCVVGDGEVAEGQIWQATLAAAYYKLDNLVAIMDKNGVQATGPIVDRYDTNPHPEKWKAFGWNVIEIDGHDFGQILKGLEQAENCDGKPSVIVAKTVKGKGISFMENVCDYHGVVLKPEELEKALEELK